MASHAPGQGGLTAQAFAVTGTRSQGLPLSMCRSRCAASPVPGARSAAWLRHQCSACAIRSSRPVKVRAAKNASRTWRMARSTRPFSLPRATGSRPTTTRCPGPPRLDAEAAVLDLKVSASDIQNLPTVAPPAQVSGAIEQLACGFEECRRDKTLSREFWPVQIAQAHAASSPMDFAFYTRRHRPAQRIEYEDLVAPGRLICRCG